MNKTFTVKYKHAGRDKEIDIQAESKELAKIVFDSMFNKRKRTSFSVAPPLIVEILEIV